MMKNTIQWRKLGLVFCASGQSSWMQTHAAVPFAEHLTNDLFRIYITVRDRDGRSFLGYVDIDIKSPSEILGISPEPILKPGFIGGFDDSGAMGCWLTKNGDVRHLYFQGWNLGVTVPFRNSIGLAISRKADQFQKYCPGPILDRSMYEPYFTATPCVIIDGCLWKMWYLSCTEWLVQNQKPKHKYHIKYAESRDGIVWDRAGTVAIDYKNGDEYAISRPSVIRDGDCWRMWYSYRGDSYRIGYAESQDGKDWKRLDSLVGIGVSDAGWDSEMIEYPFVFDHAGERYMLYNGNGYGKTGFGLAVLEKGNKFGV